MMQYPRHRWRRALSAPGASKMDGTVFAEASAPATTYTEANLRRHESMRIEPCQSVIRLIPKAVIGNVLAFAVRSKLYFIAVTGKADILRQAAIDSQNDALSTLLTFSSG